MTRHTTPSGRIVGETTIVLLAPRTWLEIESESFHLPPTSVADSSPFCHATAIPTGRFAATTFHAMKPISSLGNTPHCTGGHYDGTDFKSTRDRHCAVSDTVPLRVQSLIGGSPVAPRQEARTHEWRFPLIRGDSSDQRPLLIALPVAERQGYLLKNACSTACPWGTTH